MVFDNPDDDARARVAFELLAELTETDDDLNLLIAVIRVYRSSQARTSGTQVCRHQVDCRVVKRNPEK